MVFPAGAFNRCATNDAQACWSGASVAFYRSKSGNRFERGPTASVVALWLVAFLITGRSFAGT
jgi:hypothetical protein